MNLRDRVTKLAKTDFAGAFELACEIAEVRERIQSLGWVARYAPAAELHRIIRTVTESAGTSTDFYADCMALAWPLRALYETGNRDSIPELMELALLLSEDVRPAASRAEALVLLIHAVIPGGLKFATPAIENLKVVASSSQWRVVRAFVDVSLLANGLDRQTAINLANMIPVEKKRKSTIDRLASGETIEPRPFFC